MIEIFLPILKFNLCFLNFVNPLRHSFVFPGFVASGNDLSESLQRLAQLGWRVEERQLSEACHKFSVVIKEHSQLLAQLVRGNIGAYAANLT